MSSVYIYGITERGQVQVSAAGGLAGGIRIVCEGELAAIIGTPPANCDFCGLQREQAARLLVLHQQVLEGVIAQTMVLPAKFGTLAPDEAAVQRMLSNGREEFRSQLAELRDCLQMDIVILWPITDVYSEIAKEPGIAALRADAQVTSEESAKISLGEAVKASLERRRASLAAEIRSGLQAVTISLVPHAVVDDRMVSYVSVLLEKGNAVLLDSALERLDASHDGKLTFRCIGPLPPLAFASAEVSFPSCEDLAEAKQTLGLAAIVSASDIKAAYFRLAREHHPDTHASTAQVDAQMDAIAKAQRFLMNCVKALTPEAGGRLHLDGSAPAPVLITIQCHDASGRENTHTLREHAA